MTRPAPVSVSPPRAGIWRIGRSPNPLSVRPAAPHTLKSSRGGNRFDLEPPDAVISCASDLEACFAETLARFRPDPEIAALVRGEWERRNWMGVGALPADWRFRRSIAHLVVEDDQPFLDLTAAATVEYLREELALGLSSLGYQDLDMGIVRGDDRRVTRLIASWAFNAMDQTDPRWWGIKYRSRLDDAWDCWAVFQDAEVELLETRHIALTEPALASICQRFELHVY